MSEFYRSFGMDEKKSNKILKSIKTVETDDDWDGISAAVQFKHYYPKANVIISGKKTIKSNNSTLVLDKGTKGKGWMVDHHVTNDYKGKNVLLVSRTGEVPTSRLICLLINRKEKVDLFISATAEITDMLHRNATERGSINELAKIAPGYFIRSKLGNQFLKDEEIYTIADILAIVTKEDPEYVFKLGLKFYKKLPKNSTELVKMLDQKNRKVIASYQKFIKDFETGHFDEIKILKTKVRVVDRRGLGKFYRSVMEIARRKHIGNYILFGGKEISIRTKDKKLVKYIFGRMKSISYDQGGRAGAYGMKFKKNIDYNQFKKFLIG